MFVHTLCIYLSNRNIGSNKLEKKRRINYINKRSQIKKQKNKIIIWTHSRIASLFSLDKLKKLAYQIGKRLKNTLINHFNGGRGPPAYE